MLERGSVHDSDLPLVWHVGGEDVRMRIPLLNELKKRGFSVGAVGSESGDLFEQAGIPYWRYSLNRWVSPLDDRRSRQELESLFGKHQPSVVHGFDTKPAMLAMHAAKAADIPCRIRTINGMGYVFSSRSPLAFALRPIYRLLQRRASKDASRTVFQNSDDRDYFLENQLVEQAKSDLVLSSGIDVDGYRNSVPDSDSLQMLKNDLNINGCTIVTMVARMVRNKGVREFLEAAKIISESHSDVLFLLIGPTSSEGRQAVSVEEIGQYEPYVRFLGRRDDISALLALSDIVVLPSYYREGVPRVLLEAGALGKVLITTNMPGCREVVHHKENGLLVPIRDSKALASAIDMLVKDSMLREKMGGSSLELIRKKFALSIVADAYAEIYKRVLGI